MESTTTERALTSEEAVAHLADKHGVEYHPDSLDRLARKCEAPSHMVGRFRRYRASLLTKWALGEWTRDDDTGA